MVKALWQKERRFPQMYNLKPEIAFHGTLTKSLPSIGETHLLDPCPFLSTAPHFVTLIIFLKLSFNTLPFSPLYWVTHGQNVSMLLGTKSTDHPSSCRYLISWKMSTMVTYGNIMCSVAPILYRLLVYRLYRPKILVSAIGNITKMYIGNQNFTFLWENWP